MSCRYQFELLCKHVGTKGKNYCVCILEAALWIPLLCPHGALFIAVTMNEISNVLYYRSPGMMLM